MAVPILPELELPEILTVFCTVSPLVVAVLDTPEILRLIVSDTKAVPTLPELELPEILILPPPLAVIDAIEAVLLLPEILTVFCTVSPLVVTVELTPLILILVTAPATIVPAEPAELLPAIVWPTTWLGVKLLVDNALDVPDSVAVEPCEAVTPDTVAVLLLPEILTVFCTVSPLVVTVELTPLIDTVCVIARVLVLRALDVLVSVLPIPGLSVVAEPVPVVAVALTDIVGASPPTEAVLDVLDNTTPGAAAAVSKER